MPTLGKKFAAARAKVPAEMKLDDATAACELVKQASFAKFDETVDVAVRLGVDPRHADQVVRGTVVLPHGTGKTARVLVLAQGEKEKEARDAGADYAGLDFVQITPSLPESPPEGAALAQVQASIVANGGYFSLQDFLRRLYALDRALRADSVSIAISSLEPFGTRLSMTLATRIFFEVPGDTPGTLAPAPGGTPVPTPTPTP